MLDAFRHATGGQVCTQPLHIWKVTGKPCLLVFFDGELACDEVRPAGGQARQAQVGDRESVSPPRRRSHVGTRGGRPPSGLRECVSELS